MFKIVYQKNVKVNLNIKSTKLNPSFIHQTQTLTWNPEKKSTHDIGILAKHDLTPNIKEV